MGRTIINKFTLDFGWLFENHQTNSQWYFLS